MRLYLNMEVKLCKGTQHNSAHQEAERESAKKLTCRSEHRHQEDCESLSAGHRCCVVGWKSLGVASCVSVWETCELRLDFEGQLELLCAGQS
jgi:hypothetical protein